MENVVVAFKNSLFDIMISKDVTIVKLAKELHTDPSTLHRWFNSVRDVKLKTLIKLADYFKCSIDYLCGKTHDYVEIMPKQCPKFSVRVKELMAEYNLTPYSFLEQAGITPSKYYYWLNGGEPMLTCLDKIARSLDISLDNVVGRDK